MTDKPCAHIRTYPEDFQVFEIMDIPWSDDGEHLWCRVEKTAMNTAWLKKQLARLSGCPEKHIAHSGLKDRHAVTEQWLSLPFIYNERLPGQGEGWRILERRRHRKKLRIGTHRHNDFRITVRGIESDAATIDAALARLRDNGFANYFGGQRFGRDNLDWARSWVARGVLPSKREERGRVLSVLRAYLFNRQIDARGAGAGYMLSGDRAMLAGSHSHFAVDSVDETLRARCASGDIAPGGWLAGQGDAHLEGEAGALRASVLDEEAALAGYLREHAEADWRPLWVRAQHVAWQWQDADTLVIAFRLPRGVFATTLLEHIFTLEDQSLRGRNEEK